MLTFETVASTLPTHAEPPGPGRIGRARLLCEEARLLRARAAAAVRLAKQLRAKIAHRWLTRFTSDDPLGLTVVRCAWCGRMRTSDGKLWLISGASASEITRSLRVSHGLCPGCKKQKWLSASVENQAMLAGGCVESAGQEARN